MSKKSKVYISYIHLYKKNLGKRENYVLEIIEDSDNEEYTVGTIEELAIEFSNKFLPPNIKLLLTYREGIDRLPLNWFPPRKLKNNNGVNFQLINKEDRVKFSYSLPGKHLINLD